MLLLMIISFTGGRKWQQEGIQMQRREWRCFDLGQFYPDKEDSYTPHYNSLQQQVETLSSFLAFKTAQTGHEDTNSDVLKQWVYLTGHRRLVPLPH